MRNRPGRRRRKQVVLQNYDDGGDKGQRYYEINTTYIGLHVMRVRLHDLTNTEMRDSGSFTTS